MQRQQGKRDEPVIRFGTDGWRAIIAQDFTFDNVARVAQAVAKFLVSPARKELAIYRDWGAEYRPATSGVVVGYDMRFLSYEFAHYFARVLHKNGIPVVVSESPVPTPALSYAVVDGSYAAGIMFTASHNPAIYNGIKYKAEYGGSAPDEVTCEVERLLPIKAPHLRSSEGEIEEIGLKQPLLAKIRTLIDQDRLTAHPLRVVVDSMYGAGQGYVGQLLSEYGVPCIDIRARRNVLFAGKKPEPLEKNLIPLRAVIASMRKRGMPLIGVATDGDGDRISAMDEKGGFIDAHRTFALILRYLVEERGWRGAVVKSFALTDMTQDMCREYNLELIEVPIGFKYACEQILKHNVLIAAEESGSIAVQGHIPERDGILCSMLLAELAASSGRPISEVVEDMFTVFGPHVYRRYDVEVEERKQVVAKLRENPPERFAGRSVRSVDTLDGVKLRFKKGWLLFRASGTEPVLRLYCEMPTERDVYELLQQAERLALGELTLW